MDMDDDILQDFLIESGEILDLLSEQLIQLESTPSDTELLNAIFRGFHTIKGGAGFLALTNLVNVCHIAENVFDLLRQGKRSVDPACMDVILQTLDVVNDMMREVKAGETPSAADPALIQALEALNTPEGSEPESVPAEAQTPAAEAEAAPSTAPAEDEMTDDEFESLLDDLQSGAVSPEELAASVESTQPETSEQAAANPEETVSAAPPAEEAIITEEEFDALLDKMSPDGGSKDNSPRKVNRDDDSELISEDEFENLLDNLQMISKVKDGEEVTSTASSSLFQTPSSAPETEKPKPQAVKPASNTEPAAAKPEPAPKPEPTAAPPPQPATAKAVESKTKPAATPPAAPVKAPARESKKPAKEALAQETTVRVDTSRLDEIMNMVGELVLVRNRLMKLRGEQTNDHLAKAVGNLDVVTGDLQMSVMKTRMQPIKKVFGRFPRVVRDLARSLQKEVSLEMIGEETDLDKNLVEALSDPLVHLVRNSVDHGIESPEDRERSGKSKVGKITLSAEQTGDHILLSITDDGKGMDADVLRAVAVEKGLFDEDAAARLDEKECFNLIFMPGFSSKKEISDISGRGVGMDVVKTKITQLNGSLEIDSKPGEGSRISIKVPLTLAILPTLMVVVDEQTFALPLTSVNEILSMDLSKKNVVDGQMVITVRDKPIPLVYLHDWLSNFGVKRTKESPEDHVVIVSVGTQRIGFVVDALVGQEEVVIKALGDMLQGTAGMAGATITGDGKIAMILDIPTLLNRYAA